jgi:tetratricopeptide (TPR) repeat protein
VVVSIEDRFIDAFDRKIRAQVRLNIVFGFILLLEASLFFIFFSFFFKSALLAVMLALFLFTFFGFFVLKQYLISQKLNDFEQILNKLIEELQGGQEKVRKEPKAYDEIAKTMTRLSERLYNHEYSYYSFLKKLMFSHPSLTPWIERLSAFLHWKDVHDARELLLKASVEEYIAFVRKEPTNSEAHALLANAYVMLSSLYLDPRKIDDDEKWVPEKKFDDRMQAKFKDAAKKAIEEFKILKDYAPNDPWVYSQLAYSYRDLMMPHLEKEAYEAILALRPHDQETRYKLGALYFEQGENAKGLQIYEDLKKAHYVKADELVKIYGGTP